ncbi:MAG TPA: DMT family transporter [Feifaniaceae bacterium]|nr:DMT family transporter [Feifaniaceae bacterium]
MSAPSVGAQKRPQAKLFFLAVFCIFLWGTAIPCVKLSYPLFGIVSSAPFDQIFFAGIRFTGAGLLTLLIAFLTKSGARSFQKKHILPVLGLGLVQTTAQYICFYIGLSNTTGARGAIFNSVSTFFTVLLAAVFFRSEKVTVRKLIGCLIGFAGIIVVNLGGLSSKFTWNGDLLIMASSLFFALGSVISKMLSQNENPFLLTGTQLLFGGFALLAIGYLGGGRLHAVSLPGIALLLYLIALSATAFTIWTYLMRDHEAASVSIYFFLLPVFGVLLSGLFLGEQILSLRNLAALLFVCAGIYVVNSRPRVKITTPAA